MSTLSHHIKTDSEKSIAAWAKEFGISRPMLYGLLDGTRNPSPEVALRISDATGGAVPLSSWPNLAAVIDAVERSNKGAA